MKSYEFEVEGVSPLLIHQFRGQEEEKQIKALSPKEQAAKHLYTNDGKIVIPGAHFRGSIINAMINRAIKNSKMTTKEKNAPRIAVEPFYLLIEPQKYDVNTRAIPIKQGRKSVMDFVSQPEFKTWKVKGIIKTTLDDDMKSWLVEAGENSGVGTNRVNGYGRFKVTSFREVA